MKQSKRREKNVKEGGKKESLDSSLGITKGYWLEGQGSIPSRTILFIFSITSRPQLGSTNLLSNRYRGLFPRGLKR
jgi:hypothetical protein